MEKWFTDKTKFWRVMKVCGVQTMMALILAGASLAHDASSQILETKITLNLEDVSLEKALLEIEKAGKVKFVYSEDQLNLKEKITLVADNESLVEILDELFSPRKIKFKVHEKESSITLRRLVKEDEKNDYRTVTQKAPETITGTVTGGNPAQALAGVNVIIKGTTSGTTTDADGKFSIRAESNETLIFSFIGFVTKEMQVGERTVIDVLLQEDTKNLNDVIVNAGYWTVKDKEQTGNIARITSEEIKTQPVVNPLQALSGRMAGVFVTQETGMAGGGISVQIRGRNSLTNGNDPLYIIDGIPVLSTSLKSAIFGAALVSGSPFSTLNPNDIESIEVLKDGAATAIYGSRAANGVILITTKKGVAGKTKFDVNFSSGVTQITHMMPLLKTNDYLTMRHEAFRNDARVPTTTTAPDLLLWDTTRYTNWQKQLIGNVGAVTNLNASISGGEKNTQFLLSLGYYKESTVFPGDFGYKRGTGNFSLNHRSNDNRFQMLFSMNYQLEDNQLFNGDLTNQSLLLAPNAPEPYVNGKLNWGPSNSFSNPYANLLSKYNVKTRNFRNNLHFDYEIISGLKVKANLGYTRIETDSYVGFPIPSYNPNLNITTGQANFGTGSNETWIAEPQVEYKKNFNDGIFVALAGATFQQSIRNSSSIRGSGYGNDQLLDNLQAAPTITILEASQSQYKYNSIFGRLNYTLKQRYIVDLVGRRDGSSRFGPDNRFANFGSVSGAWIFSQETFAKQNLNFLSFGKLRASYGTSGNDQIGDYGYLDTYSTASVPYQGSTVLYPTRLANPAYSWETNRKIEGGLELGFFSDNLFVTLSYYNNRSSDQLVGLPLSGVTGFSSVQANLAATVENTGLEVEFTTVNLKRGNFSWTSNLNFTLPTNKLVEFQNLESSSYATRYVLGQSTNIDKVYAFQGVNPQTGLYQFKDVDGNGSISSPTDNQVIVNLNPTLYGGLTNTITYKGLTLNFLFQFVQQKGPRYFTPFNMPGLMRNQPQEVMQRWVNTGDVTNIEKFSSTAASLPFPAFQNLLRSEASYEDASYIRLKNISLNYKIPAAWNSKLHLQGSEVYIQAQNLLTITGYSGLDPETKSYTSIPTLRVITAGLRFTF